MALVTHVHLVFNLMTVPVPVVSAISPQTIQDPADNVIATWQLPGKQSRFDLYSHSSPSGGGFILDIIR